MENVLPRIDRRTALKWMLAATASAALADRFAFGQSGPAARGYGTDPDLLKHYKAGELWPLTFTEAQRRTAASLCDLILPADGEYPAASAVGVVDFIDEWISAPYPEQQADRPQVLDLLAWVEAEAARRFSQPFAKLSEAQQSAIADDICHAAKAADAFRQPAKHFATYRDLTAGGYYSTPEGRKDIGYVGNMPLITFDGPPPEVLKKAGLA